MLLTQGREEIDLYFEIKLLVYLRLRLRLGFWSLILRLQLEFLQAVIYLLIYSGDRALWQNRPYA